MVNSIFSIKDENYDKVLGQSVKVAIYLLLFWAVPLFGYVMDNFNPIYIILMIPAMFLTFVYIAGGSYVLYSIFGMTFPKNDANFTTQYLTKEIKTINDSIVYEDDQKYSVIKVYTESYFDKPEDVRQSVKFAFNDLIINYSTNVPKIVFRAINKKLNMIQYFDDINKELNLNDAKYKNFFSTYSKEYVSIGSEIKDHDYYVELKFPYSFRDDKIKETTNEFIRSLGSLNLDGNYYPELLKGDRLYIYMRELIAGESDENISTLPIVTEI
jgi:hypothetical protein